MMNRRHRRRGLVVVAAAASVDSCVGFTSTPCDVTSSLLIPKRRLYVSALAATSAGNDVLREGRLVEFTTGTGASKTTTLGAIIGPDGKRNLRILSSSGRTSSVPPRSIQCVMPNGYSILTEDEIEEHERAAAEALKNDATASGEAVLEVWEMLLEDDPSATIELTTLADLIAGDDSSISCYATRKVLIDGVANFCFKEVGVKGKFTEDNACPQYEPRPIDIVDALKSKAAADAEEKARWEELNERINNDSIKFDLEKELEEVRTAFQALERLGCLANLSPEEMEKEEKKESIGGDKAQSISVAKGFLAKLGRKATPESARSLLIGAGIWDIHTNLDVIRLRIPTSFDTELVHLALDLEVNPPVDLDAGSRRDLTHLPAFAIDEASTREIDDALSVEILVDAEKEGGPMHTRQILWVHIADPSRYVELGSPLDKEARRRLSSLYLPTGTVPMFPMNLAAGPLSLTPDEISCALSVGMMLDADGGIDKSVPPIITPSTVKTTRLTYEQVDKMLDPFAMAGDENSDMDGIEDLEATLDALRRLDWASEQRLQWRKDGGSLESIGPYELPDMQVKARPSADEPDGWAVDIVARERYTASRIVTELMLAANEAIAMFGEANAIPMPYRCQDMDDVSDEEIESTPEGPCRAWLAIRSTTKSQISPTPRPHAGLGLDVYVQATSPVRRYADLALHHQLKAHLRGDKLPFPDGIEGEDGVKRASAILRLAQDGGEVSRQLERPANDYWLREFLRRRGTSPTESLVLSSDRWKDDRFKLLLPELGAIVTYESNRPLAIGSQIDIPSVALAEFV